MKHYTLEDFQTDENHVDSLYRLVNIASRRANQISKPENRPLVQTDSRKSIMIALEEVLSGRVGYRIGDEEEDDYNII
jgi:DNA-directed RNA polymerase omega subunit